MGNFGLGREDCQQAVTDEFLCIVAGCVLGTDVCHWMFKTKSTWFKVKKIPLLTYLGKYSPSYSTILTECSPSSPVDLTEFSYSYFNVFV